MAAKSKVDSQSIQGNELPSDHSAKTTTVTNEVKHVSDIIGDWGWWQTNVALFCISVAIFSSFNGMVPNFYQPSTDFECTNENFVSILCSLSIIIIIIIIYTCEIFT